MEMLCKTPPNLGWIETRLDQKHIDYLWRRIDERKTDTFKHSLAGNISGSYEIEDKDDYFFNEVLKKQVDAYYNMNNLSHPIQNYVMGEFDVMYGFANLITDNFDKLVEYLKSHQNNKEVG